MADEEGGTWRTVRGTRIFIKDGEDISEAVERKFSKSGSFTNSKGESVSWKRAEPKEFQDALLKAKGSVPADKAWRVDTSHSLDDYAQDNCYILGNGSTVAVTKEGDIISVCAGKGDNVSGKDLMKFATERGGTKLDSFSGNHGFYTRCGFEPVSWTPFADVEGIRPDDWDRNRDAKEPVIFYKYTGTRSESPVSDFLAKVRPCEGESGYDNAKDIRDKKVGKK